MHVSSDTKGKRGQGNGSFSKVLATQPQGPKYHLQHPCKKERHGGKSLWPQHCKSGGRQITGALWAASLAGETPSLNKNKIWERREKLNYAKRVFGFHICKLRHHICNLKLSIAQMCHLLLGSGPLSSFSHGSPWGLSLMSPSQLRFPERQHKALMLSHCECVCVCGAHVSMCGEQRRVGGVIPWLCSTF